MPVDKFVFDELKTLSDKVAGAEGMPDDLRTRLNQMVQRLERMAQMGHYATEFASLSRYIDIVVSIPWAVRTEDRLDIANARDCLERHHYGMESVKELVIEYLASLALLKNRGREAIQKSPVLLFVGLQGVGKTTLAMSIAETLGRKFVRIAMGGIGSTLELRGRSKAFPNSEPGQVVKGLVKAGTRNPVILLDEIEKASGEKGLQSDIMAVLLEILDPNQNISFRDYYLDYPLNLSEVLFICSANNTGTLSAAVMDRMHIVKMPSYTDQEKIVIARNYLLPGILERTGLEAGELVIPEELWPGIVRPFGYDSGIRSLGRTLEAICRKVALKIVEDGVKSVTLSQENLREYLPL
jgi:ATP-dependent Lon protease